MFLNLLLSIRENYVEKTTNPFIDINTFFKRNRQLFYSRFNFSNELTGLTLLVFLLIGCATHKVQYKEEVQIEKEASQKDVSHSFYLIGDAGNAPIGETTPTLKAIKEKIEKSSANITVIYLGDNIYPSGMPKKGHKDREFAEHQINLQTDLVKNNEAEAIFVPGNHDWYSSGLTGLKRQQEYIEKQLDSKNVFFPEDGCPLQKVNINKKVMVIAIDTEWYLTNWDKHPTINDDCDIRNREDFLDEYESIIKKNADKTIIVALHHPMFSYGNHGGQFTLRNQLYPAGNVPVPILASVANVIRKTGGVTHQDIQHNRYLELQKRIVTISQSAEKIVFVAGHDHNLQYIVEDNLPQIISGAGSKSQGARVMNGSKFSYGNLGYAKLDVFKDGSSLVSFYAAKSDKEELLFKTDVYFEDRKEFEPNYPLEFSEEESASIYTEEETTKNGFHKFMWGDLYREDYSVKVTVPTVNLDTLFGGLKAIRKGGGHQSRSLRLVNSEGKEYIMRASRKSVQTYLQTAIFIDQYVTGQFENTYSEKLILDFFTGSHPYAPYVIGSLSDAIGLYHTNPVLYYIPKQNALGHFNDEHGDALYMIEERPSSGHGDQESFGYANKIIGSDDLFKNLREHKNHMIDKEAYLKARLFDMLIGDWDRHLDQWRWAVFKENGKTVYRPIPRDRDQAFSVMGDGAFLSVASRITPPLKRMEGFNDDIRNIRGFNINTFSLDMKLINDTEKSLWDEQVTFLKQKITDEVINEAFDLFPEEIDKEKIQEIKRVLIERRKNLKTISDRYFLTIHKYAVIVGTDKDDWFTIERLPNGYTKISVYEIKKGIKGSLFREQIINKKDTKEIWLYGLDDDDYFEVIGTGNQLIPIRIIGGQNKDTYVVENGKKVIIYDYKSKNNNISEARKARINLTDDYKTNQYSYKKPKNNTNQFVPKIGINPDDGLRLGFKDIIKVYGFERNPFTQQHVISGDYYFATHGFDLSYKGEFANIVGDWNLQLQGIYTSPNYTFNFYGIGNETPNPNNTDSETYDIDYNRVRVKIKKVSPSLIWRGYNGASLKVGLSYEAIDIEETVGRFIEDYYASNPTKSSTNDFFGIEAEYNFENKDNVAYPTLGMQTGLTVGYKKYITKSEGFGYLVPSLGFDYKLTTNGQLVLATKLKSHITFGNEYEFYQGANIGANDGLRGYRNQRFTGKNSYYQITDLRFNFSKIKTQLFPINIGVFAGFDYGRVWVQNDNSKKWHTSYGGGMFLSVAEIVSVNLSAFNSDDGMRYAFGLGFQF